MKFGIWKIDDNIVECAKPNTRNSAFIPAKDIIKTSNVDGMEIWREYSHFASKAWFNDQYSKDLLNLLEYLHKEETGTIEGSRITKSTLSKFNEEG